MLMRKFRGAKRLAPPMLMAALLFGSATAFGQAATPVRFNEGPGVKLSDALVFHPGAAIEMRYDSNVLFADSNLKGAPYLRFIGHLDLSTRSPQRRADRTEKTARQKIDFRLNSAFSYREYMTGGDLVRQQRAFEVDAGLDFGWSPSRYFTLKLGDNFGRTVTPVNTELVTGGSSSDTIARDVNRAHAGLRFTPGGGRLVFDAGYALLLDAFEDTYSQNNRLFHELLFNARWKLLPKTAFFVDFKQQFTDYYNASAGSTQYIGSKPLRVYGGLAGLLTPRLRLLLKAGYGNSLHDSGESFSSILAKAEFGYAFTPTAQAKVGYERSFADSVFGNFYTDHQAYLGYDHLIAGRFIAHLKVDYRFRSYGDTDIIAAGIPDSIDTNLVTGSAGLDWQIQDWVYVGLGYDIQVQDLKATLSNIAGGLDYVRHQLFGKVGVSY